jgi:hypothetical protein
LSSLTTKALETTCSQLARSESPRIKPELSQTHSDQTLVEDALKIVEVAKHRGVILRLLGALAITLRSSEFTQLHQNLKRLGENTHAFTDIDLIGYSKQRVKIREIMEDDLHYSVDQNVLLFRGKERLVYHHKTQRYHIDIFLDGLRFSHDIMFGTDPKKGRLLLDYPTIPATDLLLEKLQIHSISQKDLKDIIVLLRAHQLDATDAPGSINMKYLAAVLANDWGFWKDATTNLAEVSSYGAKYVAEGMLVESDLTDVSEKTRQILSQIEAEPKTLEWKLRERVGDEKPWWKDVEDVSR